MTREVRLRFHSKIVSEWIASSARGLSKIQLVIHFEAALDRLIRRTQTSISEITLIAVLDRVLDASVDSYSLLSSVQLDGAHLDFDRLKGELDQYEESQIKDAFHYLLTEFLFVIGNLTGEQMSPFLHIELQSNSNENVSSATGKKEKKDPQ